MKHLVLIFLIATTGCTSLRVGSDFDPTGDFKNYYTYQIASFGVPLEEVEKAINVRLNSLGYAQDEDGKIIICYSLLEENGLLMCHDQPTLSNWINSPYQKMNYDSRLKLMREQTLIISFVDPELKKVVWRGYLSDNLLTTEYLLAGTYRLLDGFRVPAYRAAQDVFAADQQLEATRF